MSGRYTILAEGRIYQTSPSSRRPLQDYKVGINADSSGIKDLLLSIGPQISASIPPCSVFFSMVSSAPLRVTFITVNPVNQAQQTMIMDVNNLCTISGAFSSIEIDNMSTTNVVECRVIYS